MMIPYDSRDRNSLPTGYKEPTSVTKLALKARAQTHHNMSSKHSYQLPPRKLKRATCRLLVQHSNCTNNDTSGSGALHTTPTSGKMIHSRTRSRNIHTYLHTYTHHDAGYARRSLDFSSWRQKGWSSRCSLELQAPPASALGCQASRSKLPACSLS